MAFPVRVYTEHVSRVGCTKVLVDIPAPVSAQGATGVTNMSEAGAKRGNGRPLTGGPFRRFLLATGVYCVADVQSGVLAGAGRRQQSILRGRM